MYEFHISRYSRDKHQFDDTLFSISGNVVFANFYAARVFADKINTVREASKYPDRSVKASDINAMGLIDEVLHFMIKLYRRQIKPNIIAEAYAWIEDRQINLEDTIELFVDLFPPVDVYRGRITSREYLKGSTEGVLNTHITFEEMILLYISNLNPAFEPYREFFDDTKLREESPYLEVIKDLDEFFRNQPRFGTSGMTLIELLLSPIKASPNSLYGQLEYIRNKWGHLLAEMMIRILGGIDFIKEEKAKYFFGPGSVPVPKFGLKDLEEVERFSPDEDWMPKLVLIAKSIHVWLFQLSKKYKRDISRLDQIPDEELEILARWGFTGLWLIGVWERSPASRTIKQMTGNPEAASSAYSIYDYVISHELGGEDAFNDLKSKAWAYGIRMATDMVPNHMGVYSKWVVEHPEWFIQLGQPPYPAYSYNGPDLSWDDRVGIFIDDGYWDRRDAAVVFKRIDRHTGDVRYIYHGNDGTSMPWNDTAQLNHLLPEVREAVIRMTLDVAKKFPIIRFDAAMTIAKRHFQRLWYPLPGHGGDIPSRSEHSIAQEEFERMFPIEFWRELVDRVTVEAPDTLLLAEAFWLMEGYFVRSLGMHRVYNSAFMNMFKTEENSKYRDVVKNVLKFNPEILRRFVNFMNNPDEAPAIDQFGKDDKYFGVATMMVTMPGLPMFGHGQIEGYAEKYGMEYTRSYWDEDIDDHLVWRHEQEIFPLLKKRRLFSGVENFVFYDVMSDHGHVNEDVFAYSNIHGHERALIVYNNRYAEAAGRIRSSVAMNVEHDGNRSLEHKSLSMGLNLRAEPSLYYIFKDMKSGLEYIRHSQDLARNGLFVHLGAFKSNVFVDFRELSDTDGRVGRLSEALNGSGVPDIVVALHELYYEKILKPFRKLIHAEGLIDAVSLSREGLEIPDVFRTRLVDFLQEASAYVGSKADLTSITEEIFSLMDALVRLERMTRIEEAGGMHELGYLASIIPSTVKEDLAWWRVPLMWVIVSRIGLLSSEKDTAKMSRAYIDEWMLYKQLSDTMKDLGIDERSAYFEALLIRILSAYQDFDKHVYEGSLDLIVREMAEKDEIREYIGVNRYDDRWWFNKESMETLVYWLYTISLIKAFAAHPKGSDSLRICMEGLFEASRQIMEIAQKSDYEVKGFIDLLGQVAYTS